MFTVTASPISQGIIYDNLLIFIYGVLNIVHPTCIFEFQVHLTKVAASPGF